MSDAPKAIPAPIAAGDITIDLPCARCGYNLRGLRADHLCPECGTPIERSLIGNLLRFADPEWLAKLRLGIALRLWNLLVAAFLGVGAVIAQFFGLFTIQTAIGILGGLLGLWAVWLITTPEPNIAVSEDSMSLRRLIRACAIIGLLAAQTNQILTVAAPAASPALNLGYVFFVLIGVGMLIGVVAMAGEFVYVRRFARRIPNPKLADNTTVVMWGLSGTMAAAAVVFVVSMVVLLPLAMTAAAGGGGGGAGATTVTNVTAQPAAAGSGAAGGATVMTVTAQPPTWAVGVMGIFGCGIGVGMLVFGIWYIVLLFQYHGALRNVLTEAQHLAEPGQVEAPM